MIPARRRVSGQVSFGTLRRATAAVLTAAVALAGAACSSDDSPPTPTDTVESVPSSGRENPGRDTAVPLDWTSGERDFLRELAVLGLPSEMTAATTVEVGIGICQGIADGADTDLILDRIRPLTSAIAAHTATADTSEVGRTIIDASLAHLCD